MKANLVFFYFCLPLAIVIFLAGLFSLKLSAEFQHPVNSLRITSLFGESRGDHFHTGIDYAGTQPILAVNDGVVIFESDASNNPSAIKLGYGNFLVLAHENNIRSHYLHLEDGSMDVFLTGKRAIRKGEKIAYMGDSGFSIGKHLHLDIINAKERKIYNPLSVLPRLKDTSPPQIVSFLLKVNDNLYSVRKRSVFKFFPSSELYVVAWDRFSPNRRARLSKQGVLGVKLLEVWQDENLLQRYDFSLMEVKENNLVLASGQTFAETYGLPFNYRIAPFSPNENLHEFTIITEDFENNTNAASYQLFFR